MALSGLQVLVSLAALGCLGLSAFGMGHILVQALRLEERDDPLATFVWSTAAGLVLVGLVLSGLGILGLLYRGPLIALTFVATFWSLGEAAQFCFAWRAARQRGTEPFDGPQDAPPDWIARPIGFAGAAVCGAALICALAPPTAYRALSHHLELPKVFLREHAIIYLPYDHGSAQPLLAEMLYLWGLLLGGGVTAQLTAWGLGLLLALAAVLLATPILGRSWAWLAAAIVVLMPATLRQMTEPGNDLAVALWLTLGLVGWQKTMLYEERGCWRIINGVMFGAALATTASAIVCAAGFACVYGYRAWRHNEGRRRIASAGLTSLMIALAIAAPWYLRAAWHGDVHLLTLGNAASTPVAAITTLLHTEIGPFACAVLPGLLLVRRLRGLRILLCLAGVYGGIAVALFRGASLAPLVPLIAVAAVWLLAEMRRMPALPRAIAVSAIGLIVTASVVSALQATRGKVAVAVGLETQQHYLYRHEPSFTAAAIVNRSGGKEAQILSQDDRGFYFEGRLIPDAACQGLFDFAKPATSPSQLNQRLKELGFTHVLLVDPDRTEGIEQPLSPLTRCVEANACAEAPRTAGRLLPMATYQVADSEGRTRQYRLFLVR